MATTGATATATRWEVRRPPIPGMDVTTVNEAGRIERIDGFFGNFAPLP